MLYKLISKELEPSHIRYAQFDSDDAEAFINALEASWISGTNSLSIPYWTDKLDISVSRLVYMLSKSKWIHSIVKPRYSSISLREDTLSNYIPTDKQLTFRKQARIKRFKLRLEKELKPSDLVKTPDGIKKTGLNREGFALSARMAFSFDTNYILKYYDAIKLNLIKSMDRMIKRYPDITIDKANYAEISADLLDYYLCNPENKYNMEANISDQRGRASYIGLRRVFNPIAYKDARALMLVHPIVVTSSNQEQMTDIYLFIAELIGSKAKSWNTKKLAGMTAYFNRKLHNLDLTDESDRKELNENIWLERIYDKLDLLANNGSIMWDIPLEMDATASIAQITGVLMNDKRLLDKTNVIRSGNLQDFWRVDGVKNRIAIKAIGTPVGYGSSASFKKLLKAKNVTLNKDELIAVKKEFSKGAFSIIRGLKDFWINHSSISEPTYQTKTWNETYTTVVNKKKPVGAELKAYTGYCTEKDKENIFMIHIPIRIPDYDRFKVYLPTGLVHNLDSIIINNCTYSIIQRGQWVISIHDAVLVLPGSGIRKEYVNQLEQLRKDRHTILADYRESIGAVGIAADIAFAKLNLEVEQLSPNIKFCESALK